MPGCSPSWVAPVRLSALAPTFPAVHVAPACSVAVWPLPVLSIADVPKPASNAQCAPYAMWATLRCWRVLVADVVGDDVLVPVAGCRRGTVSTTGDVGLVPSVTVANPPYVPQVIRR